MAKFLFFSDFHSHNFSQFSETTESGLNSRFESQLDVLGQIKEVCRDRKVDYLFCLGDVFHSRSKIDVDVGFWTHAAFMELADAVKGFYVLVGNHDQASKDGQIHSLLPFSHFAKVIDSPSEFTLGKIKVAAHPFTEDTESFLAYCQKVDQEIKPDLFLFHQGLDGATVGAYEVAIKAEIPLAALPKTPKYCLAGHYHKHQWITPRIGYIGSPMQLDFGERNEDKGFLLLDTDTWEHERILSEAPRFYLFDTQYLDKDLVDFDKDLRALRLNPEKDYIRVHVRKRTEVDRIKQLFPRVQVIYYSDAKVLHEPRVTLKEVASDRTLIESYTEARMKFATGSDFSSLDKGKLVEMGLELLGGESD